MSDVLLDAVLIPLRMSDALLLPNLAVMDVLSSSQLAPAAPGAPDWLEGQCDWQGRRVPVIRFERFVTSVLVEDADISARRERIVILHGLSLPLLEDADDGAPVGGRLFGVLSVGHPHLVTVNRVAISAAPAQPEDTAAHVLTRIRLANRAAVIPDLSGIDAELSVLTMI